MIEIVPKAAENLISGQSPFLIQMHTKSIAIKSRL